MIGSRRLLFCSKKGSREFLTKLWLKNFPYRSGSSKCSLESHWLFPDAFIYKNSKKINPYLEEISTFEKSGISCGCMHVLNVRVEATSKCKRSGSLTLFNDYRNDHLRKQQDQDIMDSIKALFETSDQEDSRDEMTEFDNQCDDQQVSATRSHNQTGNTVDEEMLEEESISQTKSEKPEEEWSDSQSQKEDDELLIPLNFFLDSTTDQAKSTSTKKISKSEKKKTKKQERREKEKAKKRKLAHSCSELEDEAENTLTTTDDNNTAAIKKDQSKKGKERKKRKKQRDESESEDNSDHEVGPKKPRPNYFVAVRVSNPAIHSSLKIIQDSMVDYDKLLEPALIPIGTLHITLMVMHLKPDEVEKAVEVLKSCESDIRNLFDDSLSMSFDELAHFRNEVVFAKINNDEEVEKLKLLATVVRNNYEKNGFSSTDDRPFTPHLTIMKLSCMQKKRKRRVKKIPPESYSSWLDCELGKETVNEVLLCSMNHKKDEQGFYHCVGSVYISNGMETTQDTNEPSQD